MTAVGAREVDLRIAPLGDVRAIDFRAADRDLWADEAALWDRLRMTLAGLDDAHTGARCVPRSGGSL